MQQLALLCIILVVLVCKISCTPGQGTFTTNCHPLTIQRADPIVNPNAPGGHVHSIVGGNAFQRSMGPKDALKANSTTCNKALDHSNYWVPQLYHYRSDKMWEIVPFTGNAVYYQLRSCNYIAGVKRCPVKPEDNPPLAFPDGFRMVAGDPSRRTFNSSDYSHKAVSIVCFGTGGRFNGFPDHKCDEMRTQVYFPSCWDGVNLDSHDHKSHVAYPAYGDYNFGVCPESHPVAIFSVFFEFYFKSGLFSDLKFAFANGDATGYGFHGDFVMGWTDRALLQTAHRDCVNAADCPKLENQPASPRPLIFPAIYEEELGLNGPISALPGNNTVIFPPVLFANKK